ncbi:MAG: hypothetical protein SFU86_12455 [Pirellulaceae bacterium]|nr:hypothetical protein [Pirellulaceae bacterium]
MSTSLQPPPLSPADKPADKGSDEAILAEVVTAEEAPVIYVPGHSAETYPPQAPSKDIPLEAHVEPTIPWPKSLPMRAWYALCWGLEWLFGLASVIGCLAVLAAIPLLNFISLGYLLEASGRVAKSGRLRDGFIDMPKFARIGSLVAGTWLFLWLPRLLSVVGIDAWLIDPASVQTGGWRIAQLVVTGLILGHILLAWYSGGRLRHFFWPLLAPFQLGALLLFGGIVGPILKPLVIALSPKLAEDLYVARPLSAWFPPAILWAGIRRGHMYIEARDAVWMFVTSLRLPQLFWLGLRGFIGGFLWLVIPTLMLIAGTSGGKPGTIVVGYLGALGLAFVMLYLPFLQTNFAAQNRFAALFAWSEVRAQFRRAPIAYWFSLTITLLFALPLYLLKVEPIPRELWWTLTLFFILFIYPARLLTGWAVGRAMKREKPRFFLFRWMSRLAAIPVILVFIFFLFFTQFTSYGGPATLLEHHAFLLPVPFVGM